MKTPRDGGEAKTEEERSARTRPRIDSPRLTASFSSPHRHRRFSSGIFIPFAAGQGFVPINLFRPAPSLILFSCGGDGGVLHIPRARARRTYQMAIKVRERSKDTRSQGQIAYRRVPSTHAEGDGCAILADVEEFRSAPRARRRIDADAAR